MLENVSLNMAALALVLVGALNWGLVGAFGFNAVTFLAEKTPWADVLERAVYVLVGAAALYYASFRDHHLPFLGHAAYPCGSLLEKYPVGASLAIAVQAAPGANVVYWAAESNANVQPNPWMAYSMYENAGVARADAGGRAVLRLRPPAGYSVPSGKTLAPHVHYRVCRHPGLMGPVQTAYVVPQLKAIP